ncbi:hypothetical protein D3C86_1226060 [compost metagenome]
MAVRRIVIAEHGQEALDRDARGVRRHDDHRLLLVAARIGIGLAHHDVDLAAGVAGARRPPLGAVDHVMVAIALDAAADIGGVRRGHVRLRHQEGRADLAAQQRFQPLVLEFFGGVALQRFHVAGVRRGAVEHLGRPGRAAHDLAHRRVFEVRQPLRCPLGARQEQVPQPGLARQRLQFLDHLGGNPGVAGFAVGLDLGVEALFVRIDMLVEKGQQPGLHVLDLGRVLELHGVSSLHSGV